METYIISFLDAFLAGKVAAGTGFPIIVLLLLYFVYKHIIKDIISKLENIPSKKDLEDAIDKKSKDEDAIVSSINERINKIIETLDDVEQITRSNYRESKELIRDVESVKQILNQFQGHMLYGTQRRSEDFGNKELK